MSDRAIDQARAQVESIIEMVAALNCDYDRLEELRDERNGYVGHAEDPTEEDSRAEWCANNPDEAAELSELEKAANGCKDGDEANQRIQEDPLSIETRSGWVDANAPMTPEEFRIVLCTGGPQVEIVGDLDDHGEPERVRILYRDWGDSGELFDFDRDAVLAYSRSFYYAG